MRFASDNAAGWRTLRDGRGMMRTIHICASPDHATIPLPFLPSCPAGPAACHSHPAAGHPHWRPGGRTDAAQRHLRRGPRAVLRNQPAVRRPLAEGKGPDAEDRPVLRRHLAPGAGHHPGQEGRYRHLQPGAGHRHTGEAPAGGQALGQPVSERRLALLQHHRLHGPQGQPEAHPRLGRSGPAGCKAGLPQPQDLGQCALLLPGGLELRAGKVRR